MEHRRLEEREEALRRSAPQPCVNNDMYHTRGGFLGGGGHRECWLLGQWVGAWGSLKRFTRREVWVVREAVYVEDLMAKAQGNGSRTGSSALLSL